MWPPDFLLELPLSGVPQGWRSEKISGGLKGPEGETRILVEGGVLLRGGAESRKSCNRFLKAEFGLKQI